MAPPPPRPQRMSSYDSSSSSTSSQSAKRNSSTSANRSSMPPRTRAKPKPVAMPSVPFMDSKYDMRLGYGVLVSRVFLFCCYSSFFKDTIVIGWPTQYRYFGPY